MLAGQLLNPLVQLRFAAIKRGPIVRLIESLNVPWGLRRFTHGASYTFWRQSLAPIRADILLIQQRDKDITIPIRETGNVLLFDDISGTLHECGNGKIAYGLAERAAASSIVCLSSTGRRKFNRASFGVALVGILHPLIAIVAIL